jgi:putative cardiolipin synthase
MSFTRLILATWLCLGLTACAGLPTDFPREPSFALGDTASTHLGRIVAQKRATRPQVSAIHPLRDGLDAYAARLAFIHAAERSLDVQTYLFHNDLTGRLMVDALLSAADRGVRIRVLLDDIDMGGRDAVLSALALHPNVRIRLFNPFPNRGLRVLNYLTHFGSVTRRMHNKSFIVDNQVAIVGGRNIGDEYFDADAGIRFGDLDVAVLGPAVADISKAFDLYWNSDLAWPPKALGSPGDQALLERARATLSAEVSAPEQSAYLERLRATGLAEQYANLDMDLYWGAAEILYDLPDKVRLDPADRSTHMSPLLFALLAGAERELIIVSPYFVPGDAGVSGLGRLVERGVKVRILTNSLASSDVPAVHAGYARYREALLRAGVELYEMRPLPAQSRGLPGRDGTRHGGSSGASRASLHAKTVGIDRRRTFVGSFNFDPRSAALNTELGIVLDNPELGEARAASFEHRIHEFAYRLELQPVDDLLAPPGREHRLVWRAGQGESALQHQDSEPEAGFWRQIQVWLLSFLPIEDQL